MKVTGYTLTPGAHLVGADTIESVDLSEPCRVTLAIYQDYVWTIRGVQEIERYFSVEGQVGAATIDVPAQRVVVYVGKNTDLSRVKLLPCKLGPVCAVTTPD
ncbi:MAG: hypothetical protein K2F72_00245, partial [Muribaculaceae bacterium]|nr:hypothetical protein [Muribaculaceae bacterium]